MFPLPTMMVVSQTHKGHTEADECHQDQENQDENEWAIHLRQPDEDRLTIGIQGPFHRVSLTDSDCGQAEAD
jgi:hypothetical protein